MADDFYAKMSLIELMLQRGAITSMLERKNRHSLAKSLREELKMVNDEIERRKS